MPLSDLFRKKPKNEPVQPSQKNPATPAKDDSFLSPEMQKKRYDAAMEFAEALQARMPLVGGKPHAGTLLAITGRLAGSSLFRSLNYDNKEIKPGVVVLSEEVNQAWPQLMNQFAFYCKQGGLDVMSKPMVTEFPELNKPLMSVDQVLTEYQDQYHVIMKKHGLDYLNAARAGMVVASFVFEYHCKKVKDIDPFVATGIVAMGVVEGAKTAPPALKSAIASPASTTGSTLQKEQVAEILRTVVKSSTSGSGTRLVLGEGMDAMQDAMTKGGKYVLVHPAVVEQLQQNKIDPYYVYETALRIELKSNISRIDFVNADVNKLFESWRGKPEKQMPIHVRLIDWLKKNAAANGYEQRGNSWIRK
jgi:hypothetical protein